MDPIPPAPWAIERTAPPWGDRPAILPVLPSPGDGSASGLDPVGLPDEERVSAHGLRWVAGGRDGAGTHHVARGGHDAAAAALWQEVLGLAEEASDERALRLYEAAVGGRLLPIADAIVDSAREGGERGRERISRIARWLVQGAADREPLKLGIVLLGVAGDASDRPVLERLARHDEFTLFAVVALGGLGLADERSLWAIAKDVHGWGRIHAVEMLAGKPGPEVRPWLLREGFRTLIMTEYLALACAQGGGLAAALETETIDDALLQGAGEILSALAATTFSGPASGFEAYADGVTSVRAFLRHASREARTLGVLVATGHLRRFAEDGEFEESVLAPLGWTAAARAEIVAAARVVLDAPEWPARVRVAVASDEEEAYALGSEAADELGMDLWETHFARLARETSPSHDRWWRVCRTPDAARMERVVRLAEEKLPVATMASGPATEDTFRPTNAPHRALGWILQELRRFPGLGEALLRVGLRSPVTLNRRYVVSALEAWDRAAWPDDLRAMIETASRAEPDATVRAEMERLLR